MFYLGKGNTISLQFTPDGTELIVGGAYCANRDEVIEALKAGKYRFQIGKDDLNNKALMDQYIADGIITSEMRSFIRKGASLGVNALQDTDEGGNPVQVHVLESDRAIARTAGSSMSDLWHSAGTDGISNIRIGKTGYRLNPDGTVTHMTSRFGTGEVEEKPQVIAQVKAIAELMTNTGAYPGKRWSIKDKKYQYTEMYEREIDGITVHMVKRGENGAYLICYGDDEWNALMEVATPFGPKYTKPEQPESESPTPEDYKAFNEAEAKKEGGKVEQKQPGKLLGKRFSHLGKGTGKPKTVQQETVKDEQDQNDIECP